MCILKATSQIICRVCDSESAAWVLSCQTRTRGRMVEYRRQIVPPGPLVATHRKVPRGQGRVIHPIGLTPGRY